MQTIIYIHICMKIDLGKPPSFNIFLAGEMSKIIHQTDLRLQMARFWGRKPDKDRTVSFISHRSFKSNQLKLIEMIWIDVNTWILHQNDTLSPRPDVFSTAANIRVSDHVFSTTWLAPTVEIFKFLIEMKLKPRKIAEILMPTWPDW